MSTTDRSKRDLYEKVQELSGMLRKETVKLNDTKQKLRLSDDSLAEAEANARRLEADLAGTRGTLAKREARIARLNAFTGAEAFVKKMRRLVGAVMLGKTPAAEVTKKDAQTLETVYTRTLPYAALSPEKEAELRGIVRRTAKADFDAGGFQTYADALRHYGLDPKTEGAENA